MNKKASGADAAPKCGCGCGEVVTKRFKPGHDARLKSQLLKQYRTGTTAQKRAARTRAKAEGWDARLNWNSEATK